MALGLDIFEAGLNREYTLPWGDLSTPDRKGTLKMKGGLFNYYFLPVAFGFDGAYYERTVKAAGSYTMQRRIGGPTINVSGRQSYKIRVTPTSRRGGYDTGQQMYAIEGDDLWNFEITGRVTEFRIWVRNCGRLGQLKRPLIFKTATGTGSASLPIAAGN